MYTYEFSFLFNQWHQSGKCLCDHCTGLHHGLWHCDRLIDYLLEKGIEPLVTLYHFECPQALVDAFGGWLDRKMIDAYLKYATEVGEISLRREPGVLTMYAVREKENPCRITILET